MLCRFCTDIDLDALDSFEGYHHHASFKDLQHSASAGCELCILIQGAHREHEGGLLEDDWVGSKEDTQIRMGLADLGLIEVSQVERRKFNHRPFLTCIIHFCTEAGTYEYNTTATRTLKTPQIVRYQDAYLGVLLTCPQHQAIALRQLRYGFSHAWNSTLTAIKMEQSLSPSQRVLSMLDLRTVLRGRSCATLKVVLGSG
jgi:hypothetical protein